MTGGAGGGAAGCGAGGRPTGGGGTGTRGMSGPLATASSGMRSSGAAWGTAAGRGRAGDGGSGKTAPGLGKPTHPSRAKLRPRTLYAAHLPPTIPLPFCMGTIPDPPGRYGREGPECSKPGGGGIEKDSDGSSRPAREGGGGAVVGTAVEARGAAGTVGPARLGEHPVGRLGGAVRPDL